MQFRECVVVAVAAVVIVFAEIYLIAFIVGLTKFVSRFTALSHTPTHIQALHVNFTNLIGLICLFLYLNHL